MSWKTKWKVKMQYFFAKTIYKSADDETPILMDPYQNNNYYYILNDNNHYVYSIDEVYEITLTNKKDPITREPIFNHEMVRVKIKNIK